jgi:hypothetical protein
MPVRPQGTPQVENIQTSVHTSLAEPGNEAITDMDPTNKQEVVSSLFLMTPSGGG